MRLVRSAFCGVLVLGSIASAHGDNLPQRKPGLWEMSISSSDGDEATHMKHCIDKSTDEKLLKMGTNMNSAMGGTCKKNTLKATASGFETESECSVMGSTISSKGIFTGDFSSAYTGKITTSFNPPLMGQKETTSTVSAKWMGVCGEAMQPGDMVMPNGMKMNIETAAAQARQAADMMKNPQFANALKQLPQGLDKGDAAALADAMDKLGAQFGE
jgi:hypothetical protein